MKHLIKRYPNRKLYHFIRKKYITLEDISELIKKGEQVQIIDHLSGEDISTRIMAQIVQELEENRDSSFARTLLERIIRTNSEIKAPQERSIFISDEILLLIENEIERLVKDLEDDGKISPEQTKILIEELCPNLSTLINDQCNQEQTLLITSNELVRSLQNFGLPTYADFNHLDTKLQQLFKKVEALSIQIGQNI